MSFDTVVDADSASITPFSDDESADYEWYREQSKYRKWSERLLWAALAHLGRPQSFADFGCGDAWMVRTARMIGARPAIGVESVPAVRRFKPRWGQVVIRRLDETFTVGRKFDMVMSIGSGEQITEDKADVYADNLVAHTGFWLVFAAESSPIPAEGAVAPSNPPQQDYWRAKLVQRGLHYDQRHSDNLRATWTKIAGPLTNLARNVQVFRTTTPVLPSSVNGVSA